jgi:EAL domain-containing protein (putative c-di-GMP-specific phosphodiesterase class I)
MHPNDISRRYALAYCPEINDLLRALNASEHLDISGFIDEFYGDLDQRGHARRVLDLLTPIEFEHLKRRQATHLRRLLSDELSAPAHYAAALEVGRVHELISLGLPATLEAYHLYHEKIVEFLLASDLPAIQREQISAAAHQRVMLEIEAQSASHEQFNVDLGTTLVRFDQVLQEAHSLADLLRESLDVLAGLDGVAAVLFSRPGVDGTMHVEAYAGRAGEAYAQALEQRHAPMFETRGDVPAGVGPAGRALRTQQIQTSDAIERDPTMAPWHQATAELGLRSVAAVPLPDENGQPFVVLSLYSGWPGFFRSAQRKTAMLHIQQTLGRSIRQHEQSLVIPAQLRRHYRQCLDEGRVLMLYQPVVDLRSGRLDHVEALARMLDTAGHPIAPASFLPALEGTGLLQLFRVGLEQVCSDIRAWQRAGLDCPVSINLPTEGLTRDAYRDILFDALTRWQLAPGAVQLEMLETQDPLDLAKRDARLNEFRSAGVRVEQDDLGAGHSSLLRMDQLPFDGVKIDQGLVRKALSKPVRALRFIYHLTRLAHDFDVPVTVEGLEDEGLIEASLILGADRGQGYGIARPMPARELPHWCGSWSTSADLEKPRTALGALAGYVLWDQQLGALEEWPELREAFIAKRCRIRHYLDRQGGDATLADLIDINHAAARLGRRSAAYVQSKRAVIEHLSQHSRRAAPARSRQAEAPLRS